MRVFKVLIIKKNLSLKRKMGGILRLKPFVRLSELYSPLILIENRSEYLLVDGSNKKYIVR